MRYFFARTDLTLTVGISRFQLGGIHRGLLQFSNRAEKRIAGTTYSFYFHLLFVSNRVKFPVDSLTCSDYTRVKQGCSKRVSL